MTCNLIRAVIHQEDKADGQYYKCAGNAGIRQVAICQRTKFVQMLCQGQRPICQTLQQLRSKDTGTYY